VVPMPQDLQLRPQIYEPQGGSFVGGATVISGTVVDSQGAVVPGAQITITNTSTGENYTTSTDSSGSFSRSGLASAAYNVRADVRGFKSTVMQGARPGQNLQISLQVGTVSETVNVSAEQTNELPINGR